jgi:predicted  nucleic acid-binding Zn-ribbon protein
MVNTKFTLVERLRNGRRGFKMEERVEAADALEALAKQSAKASQEAEQQARRIAELEDEIRSDFKEATAALEAQAHRIAELEAALKPFLDNDWWEQTDWTDKTEREVWVTMGDLRAARAALENKND